MGGPAEETTWLLGCLSRQIYLHRTRLIPSYTTIKYLIYDAQALLFNSPPAVAGGASVLPRPAAEGKATPPLLEISRSSDLVEPAAVLVVVVVVVDEPEHRPAWPLSTISEGCCCPTA